MIFQKGSRVGPTKTSEHGGSPECVQYIAANLSSSLSPKILDYFNYGAVRKTFVKLSV